MKIWKCGRFNLEIGAKTYIMGIVNATPDSFSGDGTVGDSALERALKMVEDGADILDIGGESTRPGATPVSLEEELSRVLPLIEKLAVRVKIPLSIDTTKSEVARRALDAGASIVNDISGATFDPKMFEIVAATNAGLILMHLRGKPQQMRPSENFGEKNDVIFEIAEFWKRRLEAAREIGISDDRIAFDAGFGFGKSLDENLAILRRGRELSDFGFPILSGTSRKSTIGKILEGAPVEKRIFGTAATTSAAILNGADMVRVHDVAEMRDVARVCDAICR
ncbi:MAG TPA: dihydropteroate synthase [Abditibacterium sp.]|jgi:dihydropteroate synthase